MTVDDDDDDHDDDVTISNSLHDYYNETKPGLDCLNCNNT
jgi:hypothetical protein